jgi:predicted deacylase
MAFDRITHTIDADAPGTTTQLTLFKVGPADAATKIYMQAALHADEQPGIMALHHLLPLLKSTDEKGELSARFTIFPMVNPLGMGQRVFEDHVGRYDFRSGTNFNRRWPDLFAAVDAEVASKLTNDAAANVAIIRQAVRDWLDAQRPTTAMQKLRHLVMTEAYDADYVLDLHCDNEALVHLFVTPDSMAELGALADHMGSVAQLTAEDSGGGSFDEVWPSLWTRLVPQRSNIAASPMCSTTSARMTLPGSTPFFRPRALSPAHRPRSNRPPRRRP